MTERQPARPNRSIRVTRRHGFCDERIEVHGTVTVRPGAHSGDELPEEIVQPIRVWMRPDDVETLREAGETVIGPHPGTLTPRAGKARGAATVQEGDAAGIAGQITLALDLDPTATPRRAVPGWGIRTVRTITI